MAKETFCPICKEVLGTCCHNRADMILTIIDSWDRIKEDNIKKDE